MRLAVFISGRGSNLKELIEANKQGFFKSKICLVVANKEARGLEYAKENKIAYLVSKDERKIKKSLDKYKIDLVILAGYLVKVSDYLIDSYEIINIHPSLLPKYGGKGFYGDKIHKVVFENKDQESGVSIHYVNSDLDGGEIIAQRKIDVSKCQSPEEIGARVLEIEHEFLKEVVKDLENRLDKEL